MSAYVIADIDVHDQETYREYGALVPDTLKPHGGRFIVRGGASETIEGDWQPRRLVVIEFPTAHDPRRWHASPGDAPALAMRQRPAGGSLVLVEGAGQARRPRPPIRRPAGGRARGAGGDPRVVGGVPARHGMIERQAD